MCVVVGRGIKRMEGIMRKRKERGLIGALSFLFNCSVNLKLLYEVKSIMKREKYIMVLFLKKKGELCPYPCVCVSTAEKSLCHGVCNGE
jgi:hypothetical protein